MLRKFSLTILNEGGLCISLCIHIYIYISFNQTTMNFFNNIQSGFESSTLFSHFIVVFIWASIVFMYSFPLSNFGLRLFFLNIWMSVQACVVVVTHYLDMYFVSVCNYLNCRRLYRIVCYINGCIFPSRKFTLYTNVVLRVNIVEVIGGNVLCYNNIAPLLRRWDRHTQVPFSNRSKDILEWAVRTGIPIMFNTDGYAYCSSTRITSRWAILYTQGHVEAVRIVSLAAKWNQYGFHLDNVPVFGFRHLAAKRGAVTVKPFLGYNGNIGGGSLTSCDGELRIKTAYGGTTTLGSIALSAANHFDPDTHCMWRCMLHHSFLMMDKPTENRVVDFFTNWIVPQSWAFGFVDEDDPDVVHVFSDNRRVTNLLLVNGEHMESFHVPISLCKNSFSYFRGNHLLGARGKKGKNNNNNNNNKPAVQNMNEIYPGQKQVLSDIAQVRDSVDLLEISNKRTKMTKAPKQLPLEKVNLTGKICYLRIESTGYDLVLCWFLALMFVSFYTMSHIICVSLLGPMCLVISFVYYYSPKYIRQYVGDREIVVSLANLCMLVLLSRSLFLWLWDFRHKTMYMELDHDLTFLLNRDVVYGAGRYFRTFHWVDFTFLLIITMYVAYAIRYRAKRRKFHKLHMWSDECEVIQDDSDHRVDVHQQGEVEHFQKISNYTFEYYKCKCGDGNNCKHYFKKLRTSVLPVCNELLSQLLGANNVRPCDDISLIKERMIRCIANNSSINRNRYSNISDLDLDSNTLRVALAIVNSRKIRADRKAYMSLPLNF